MDEWLSQTTQAAEDMSARDCSILWTSERVDLPSYSRATLITLCFIIAAVNILGNGLTLLAFYLFQALSKEPQNWDCLWSDSTAWDMCQ